MTLNYEDRVRGKEPDHAFCHRNRNQCAEDSWYVGTGIAGIGRSGQGRVEEKEGVSEISGQPNKEYRCLGRRLIIYTALGGHTIRMPAPTE